MIEDILTKKPFNLNTEQIEWVKKSYNSLSLEQKIGQLFILPAGIDPSQDLSSIINKYHPGGFMFRPLPSKVIFNAHQIIQANSKIPAFLAANVEAGGNGIVTDGTFVGSNMQVAATNNLKNGYLLGKISALELKAVGGNLAFAPVSDINFNFHNPVINLRGFSDKTKIVEEYCLEYLKGCQEQNVAVSVKHFPGDGVDSRDQHLHATLNNLSVEEWDKSFGKIYQKLIDNGALTFMIGHFLMPNYVKALKPIEKEDINLPASFNKTIINKLLREKLQFNGLIISDATLMTGFTSFLPRHLLVPKIIAAGVDIFLFTRNLEEDYNYMLDGYQKGIISDKRLEEALIRILATKAKLNLNKEIIFDEKKLAIINCKEHQAIAKTIRDESITLVRNNENILPLKKIKKVMLLYNEGKTLFEDPNQKPTVERIISFFKKYNVEVDYKNYQENPIQGFIDATISIKELKSKYDLIVYFAKYGPTSNSTTLRLQWNALVGMDAPNLIKEIPTIFISLGSPYHLYDVPHIQTFVNAYSDDDLNLELLFAKLFGKSQFKGHSPVNVEVSFLE